MSNKFYWSNFDADFLNRVLASPQTANEDKPQFESDDPEELSSFVETITPMPDRKFVKKYRGEIEMYLRYQPDLVLSVFGTKDEQNHLSVLNRISKKTMGETLANKYIEALCRIGYNNPDYILSDYTSAVTIDLEKCDSVKYPLYDFQKKAVEKLEDFLATDKNQSGLLVMPTGSGKTRTAVQFLLRSVIAQGYQVIWLTHRHMLIEQTAEQFYKMSPMIREANPDAKSFRFLCVSGMHSTIKAVSKKEDLIIVSVQTAYRNMDYLKKCLKSNVLIVVDESHHSSAPSWSKVIQMIRKRRPNTKLLGLTATPVRLTEGGTAHLQKMFEQNTIYNVEMSELITKKVLATPQYTRVDTLENFEPLITPTEGKYILRNSDLPPSVMNKIASSKRRNKVIIDQYMKHDYGKTLIFAMNIIHAKTLTEELKKRGVKADCVYSGQGNDVNQAIIARFASKEEGALDVLVNVNILSEGSDCPCIETVFLTRPTQSESLLVQMIGRGMRGTSAGGTEEVNIVDFCDKWEIFDRWLSARDWLAKVMPEEEPQKVVAKPHEGMLILWKDILNAYQKVCTVEDKSVERRSIPLGWFSLSDSGDDYTLLVFDGQQSGYVQMAKDRKELKERPMEVHELARKYFGGMYETPKYKDIEVYFDNLMDGIIPHFYPFVERNRVEPFAAAKRVRDGGEDLFAVAEELYQSEVAQHFFPTIEEYRERIFQIVNYKMTEPSGKIEEMPLEMIPYQLDKPYDIQELYQEVVEEMFNGKYDGIRSLEWTDKPYKGYYGRYLPDNTIQINIILNSSNVKKEVVKYVIYHELLHRDYYYHDKNFRREEHKYPNYTEWEKVLDVDFGKFEM